MLEHWALEHISAKRSALMQAAVARLTLEDFVAIIAYTVSLDP
ncbi:MAG: hypothetical protein QF897_08645 [Gammaproteobacteria bacterium]|jgi:hypothetical protein|nr:hypothetical protein [Gammaproteobacteria bacterium]